MSHSFSSISARALLFAGAAIVALPTSALANAAQLEDPAAAQEAATANDDTYYEDDIVVTAPRMAGQVVSDIKAVVELDEAAIASYGASSISELLEALETQTRSGRGRGGRPIMLVNGRRTSGFNSIRNIPPEAIAKVEIFPEELALQYGFEATERVVNFVLKPDFKQISFELEGGVPTAGGRFQSELEPTFIAISKNGRININAGWEHKGLLLESDRDVTPTSGTAEDSFARSLLSASDSYVIDGTMVRNLDRVTDATISARFEQTDSLGLLGLSNDGLGNARRRKARNQDISLSGALNGMVGSWRWSMISNYGDSDTRTYTERDSGARDRVDNSLQSFGANANMSGAVTEAWAGPIQASVTAGYSGQRFDSRTENSRGVTISDLGRDTPSVFGTVTIPLLDPDYEIGNVGRVSLTLNAKAEKPSDFSSLTSWGSSLNWGVTKRLSLIASYNSDQSAPGMSQLGATILETDDVTYYDFTAGQTVNITTVTGGNPDLLREKRRDMKFGLNWEVPFVEGMRFSADYNSNRSTDTANSFPVLTPEIEAAFADLDRVTRVNGVLTRLDQRPVNFAESENSQIRYGLNFGKSFGQNNAAANNGSPAEGARSRGDGMTPPREGNAASGTADNGPAGADRPVGRIGTDGERRGPRGRALCVTADQVSAPLVNGTIEGAVMATRTAPAADAPEGTRPRLSCPSDLVIRFIPAAGGEGGLPPVGAAPPADMTPPSGMGAPSAGGMRGPGGAGRGFGMRGPRGMGGMGGQSNGGRWQASIYHTIKLTDRVTIADGVPELDLLNGSATGSGGGSSRHLIEADGGLFYKGFGSRFSMKYDSGSTIMGGANGDLKFHDLATFNLRVFADFNQMPKLTAKMAVLKNSRLRLSVNNLFDAQRKVTDNSGIVPLNYQPGYLDPLGRYVELSWRKSF